MHRNTLIFIYEEEQTYSGIWFFSCGSLGFAVTVPIYRGGFWQNCEFLPPYVEKLRDFPETLSCFIKQGWNFMLYNGVIISTSPVFSIGLSTILEKIDTLKIIGMYNLVECFVHTNLTSSPHLLLLDCDCTDAITIKKYSEYYCNEYFPRILAFTNYTDGLVAQMIRDIGAHGCFLKNESPQQIVEAVESLLSGKKRFSPKLTLLMNDLDIYTSTVKFTNREKEVLHLLVKGLTNKHISKIINVKERTVTFHISNILKKLNVPSRLDAIIWVYRNQYF